jgi:hypothetical protein
MWVPVLPADPEVARWWREAAEREEAERRAAQRARSLVVPAMAAKVRRTMRDLDAALEGRHAGPAAGRHPELRRRRIGLPERPQPDHGVGATRAGVLEYSHHYGQILRIW